MHLLVLCCATSNSTLF